MSKASVGVITFHLAVNYGAILQTYALQQAISALGCDSQVINYQSHTHLNRYKKRSLIDCRSISDILRLILYRPVETIKKNKFSDFISRNIKLSEPCYSKEELAAVADKMDYVVTGSDQVWNFYNTGFDKRFFLDFVQNQNKKISYAASFGTDHLLDEYKEGYRDLLLEIPHISVREEQGRELINKVLGIEKQISVVLDPVFLLDKVAWEKIAKNQSPSNKPYILVYLFGKGESVSDFIRCLAKETGCEVICISSSFLGHVKGKYIRTAGPEEFISLFLNSKYIVTNSFHGTAFAINFNKPFFTELLPGSSKVNSRLENVLDTFELRERQVVNGKVQNPLANINYDKVNVKLKEKREMSLNFLKKGLGI